MLCAHVHVTVLDDVVYQLVICYQMRQVSSLLFLYDGVGTQRRPVVEARLECPVAASAN